MAVSSVSSKSSSESSSCAGCGCLSACLDFGCVYSFCSLLFTWTSQRCPGASALVLRTGCRVRFRVSWC
eukprot:2940345-Amphidinium_carterae.1